MIGRTGLAGVVAIGAMGLAVAGCAVFRDSLYDRLGRLPYIQAVVDDFVANVAADNRINKRFEKTNIPVLKKHLVDQICEASGGPCKYTGRDMKSRPHRDDDHRGRVDRHRRGPREDPRQVQGGRAREERGAGPPRAHEARHRRGCSPAAGATKLYVVTHPASVGIYATWPECAAAVRGVSGARYQAVTSRAGRGHAPRRARRRRGRYAFVDGNHMGGIGVVLVETDADADAPARFARWPRRSTRSSARPGSSLDTRAKITDAANRLRNVLAELGGLPRRSSWPPPASR